MKNQMKFKDTEIGRIPEDWDVRELYKVADIIMGQSPPSDTYNQEKTGLPFFQGRKDFGSKYPLTTIWCSNPTRIAKKDDVLLSVRAPIGDVNIAKEKCCIGRGLSIICMKNENNDFLYYLLRQNSQNIQRIYESEGTVFGCLTKNGLHCLKFAFPPNNEQQAIAKILSELDSKIELNQQLNKTLEAIGQAIFKRWFIDFEFPNEHGKPYKSSGGEMVDSELGEIPKGWKVGIIADDFNLTMGQSPPGSTYNENGEGISFFQGRTDFGFRYPTERIYCTEPSRFAESGDTLVSVRAPVGDINKALKRCCIGRGLASIRHKTRSRSYTYCTMQMLKDDFAEFEAEGTVFGSITKNKFEEIQIIIPHKNIVNLFEKVLFALDQLIENNEIECITLSQIRDSLLPKLMSGKIRVI